MALHAQALQILIERMVDENPVAVTIERSAWEDDGAGGRTPANTTLGPITLRIEPAVPKNLSSVWDEAGRKITSGWVAYGVGQVDVKAEDHTRDTLVGPDGARYRVSSVHNLSSKGVVFGTRIELDREV